MLQSGLELASRGHCALFIPDIVGGIQQLIREGA